MLTPAGYAVISLETTGFGGADRVIEVGVVLLAPNLTPERSWSTLVNPDRGIPSSLSHGLSAEDVADAPRFEQIAAELAGLLGGRLPVAHNAEGVQRFLRLEYRRLGADTGFTESAWLDTAAYAQRLWGIRSLHDALSHTALAPTRSPSALSKSESIAELLRVIARSHGISYTEVERLSLDPNGLPAGAPPKPRSGEGADTWDSYRSALQAAVAKRPIDLERVRALRSRPELAAVSPEDVAAVHDELLRQLAVKAWFDGVVTDAERTEVVALGEVLGADPASVAHLFANPEPSEHGPWVPLGPGERVAFAGVLDLPREEWEAKANSVGLIVSDVTEETAVLVAAYPRGEGPKIHRARDLGVPIISETRFAQIASGLEPAAAVVDAVPVSPWASFTWLGSDSATAAEVAEAWIEHYPSRPLHEMSYVLTPNTPIDFPATGVDKVVSRWSERYERLLDATAFDVKDLPGVGTKRLRTLVEAVVLTARDAAEVQETGIYVDTVDKGVPEWSPDSAEQDALRTQVAVLSGWLALTGVALPEGTTSASLPDMPRPEDGADALRALFAGCVVELSRVCAFDERYTVIAKSRLLGDTTLDEIGASFGVSRERVRQLQSSLLAHFGPTSGLSQAVGKQLATLITPLASVEQTKLAMPALFELTEFDVTYEEYFRRLFGTWLNDGAWITSTNFDSAARAAIGQRDTGYGASAISLTASDLGVDPELLTAWLDDAPGVLVLPDRKHVVIDSNHQDRAAAVLSIHGAPMTTEEIVGALGNGANPRSVGNQISVDERIIRVANSLFGLREWGQEEFKSIHEWIGKRIDESGGQVALDELMKATPGLRISENSVYQYASSVHYELSGGMVRRKEASAEAIDADPQESRDLYFRDGAWHLLVTVNSEHLRGSGFQVPRGVPGIYNVEADSYVDVPSRLGPQAVRVNKLRQPSLATIRRFLEDIGAGEGKRVWLRFDADLGNPNAFDVTLAPDMQIDGSQEGAASGLAWLLDRMALDTALAMNQEAAMRAINTALGLDPDAPRRRAAAIFGHRRQDDLADVIRAL